MTMRIGSILLVGAALCVFGVGAHSPECIEALAAAIEYRDYAKATLGPQTHFKTAAAYFNIDLHDDKDIEQFICTIIAARERTITYIATHNTLMYDPTQLALAYTSLVNFLQDAEVSNQSEVYDRMKALEFKVTFLDRTGFPDFPLKIRDAQLSELLSALDDTALAKLGVFMKFADWFTSGAVFYREKLFAALNDSESLEDFARATMQHKQEVDPFEYHDYSDEDVSEEKETLRKFVLSTRAEYLHLKERVTQAEQFLNVLKKTGFLEVTRGGPELYSCDFIADTAVETLGYAVTLFGRDAVQNIMRMQMRLNFTVDDTAAVRAWVCSLVASKSREDVMKVVPEDVMEYMELNVMQYVDANWMYLDVDIDRQYMHPSRKRYMDTNTMYKEMVFYIQYALVNPDFLIGPGMADIRMTQIMERLNFPDVPRYRAMQLAAILKLWTKYLKLDVDEVAQILQDADSFDAATSASGMYHFYRPLQRWKSLEGKVDTVLQLASCVYQLAMSAEELGLFMLPR